MTREVYDALSKDTRQQIKCLQKRQKDLDRHDKMIREEIDKEIEDINKQIAEL